MNVKDELIFDFSINLPRILVGGKIGIIDNVKKIIIVDGSNVVVNCGKRYISFTGKNLIVEQLSEERMLISGDLNNIEFYGSEG